MKNPATMSQDELNYFTQRIVQFGDWQNLPYDYFVQLRNGDLVRPFLYKVPEDMIGFEEPHFYTVKRENSGYRWNLDGTSLKNRDFDMMEIVVK